MIPKLHYISQGETPEQHLEHIQSACTSGVELVQLRLKNVDEATLLKTAQRAREITMNYQTRLIINDHYKVAITVKADGVHLGKTDSDPIKVRKELYKWQWIGGTANTFEDCLSLIDKKVDYIGLGPFRFTQTKQNLDPVLGIEGYTTILKKLNTETPIIAIGGITVNDVSELLKTGIYGVAASGAVTQNFNSIQTFHKLLQTGILQEQVWDMNKNK